MNTNGHRRCVLLAVSFLLGGISAALANGLRLVSQDAFAAARAEAFVATADNPSAVYYNPAGLTQLQGQNVRAGANLLYFDPTFEPLPAEPNSGTTYHIENNYAFAPQFYYSYGWRGVPISMGLGVYSPYGASVTWPQDTGFRTVATEGSLTYIRANPVVAAEIAPGLSLACGIMVDYGDIDAQQGVRASPSVVFPNDIFSFSGDDWTVGYNVGLLWKAHEKLSFGATFRSQTTVNFKGNTFLERAPTTPPTEIPATAEYEFPLTAVFGVSYRPTPKWNLEFNADYTDWSSFDVVTIRQERASPFPLTGQVDIPITFEWKASWILEVGATHYFDDGWHASAGCLYNQNSVPDTYYSPLVSDLDRYFVAIGVGRKGRKIDFDVTYQFGYGPPHAVTGSQPPSIVPDLAGQNSNGTYEWISHAVLVSVGLHF